MKKVVSTFMACTLMIAALAFNAAALDSDIMPESMIPDNESELVTVTDGKDMIVTPRYVITGDDVLFEMTISSLSDGHLLTTKSSGKKLYRSDITEGLYVSGYDFEYEHGSILGNNVKVGVATYNSSTGVFRAKTSLYVNMGKPGEDVYDKYELAATAAHYGYVNNTSGVKITHGKVLFADYKGED